MAFSLRVVQAGDVFRSRDLFNFREITHNILETVQDRNFITTDH